MKRSIRLLYLACFTLLLGLFTASPARAQSSAPFVLQDAAGDTLVQVNSEGSLTPLLGLRFADGTLQTTAASAAAAGWLLGGNAGTAPGTHFLGTSDATPFEIQVDGQRVMRFEPGLVPNVIGGFSGNLVGTGVRGATIGGGGAASSINQVTANFSTVGGGSRNTASGQSATVGGGGSNTASGGEATVSGGIDNTASGSRATVPGGQSNTASAGLSFAAGFRAKANHTGAFVWADVQQADFASANINTFNVRAENGFYYHHGRVFSNTWPIRIHNPNTSFVAGMRVTNDGFFDVTNHAPATSGFARLTNSGNWSAVSDRRLKRDITPATGVLTGVLQLQPARFRYRDDASDALHLGLIAQEVQAVFPEFVTEGEILTLDYAGLSSIALGAIREQQAIIELQQGRIGELEARLARLEASMTGTH